MSRRKKENKTFQSQRITLPGQKNNHLETLSSFGDKPDRLIVTPSDKYQAPSLSGYKCTGAWEVKNPNDRRSRFDQVAGQIGNVKTLYHGTPARNIVAIATEGLRPGRGYCMFGSGIYMGSPAKAIGFSGSGHDGDGGTAHYIIEVKAALGRIWEQEESCDQTLDSVQEAGYHSVAGIKNFTRSYCGTLMHDEYVVYSPSQVMAIRVFEYQSTIPKTSYYGECMILKPNPDPPPHKSKAWADLYAEKPCGATGVVKLQTNESGVYVVVCKACLERLKLKKGDKVRIRKTGYHSTIEPVTVTIKGRW